MTESREIPAPPERWYITAFNLILDLLLEGVTANVAYAALIAQFPALAGWFTKWLIDKLFAKVNERAKVVGDKELFRLGNEFRKITYDDAIKVLKEKGDNATDEELRKIKAAMDRVIYRG